MATLKDVTARAGVGLGTASRVISGKGAVSPATQTRVRQVIEEFGFEPSHAARSVIRGRSHSIGMYVPHIVSAFYLPNVTNGIRAFQQSPGHDAWASGPSSCVVYCSAALRESKVAHRFLWQQLALDADLESVILPRHSRTQPDA